MATIKNFEEIEAWQKARELCRAVYTCSGKGAFAKDYALRDQIRRSVISIISNIAEGFERGGSAGEVEAQLYIALDQGYLTEEEFNSIRAMAASTKKLVSGFMNYLKQSGLKGQKFKQPGTRNQRPETRDQEPETRDQ